MMEMHYYFPTAIYSGMNLPLAKEILPIVKKYLDDDKFTKNLGYRTTFSACKLHQYPEFNEFNSYVCNLGHEFLDKQGYDSRSLNLSTQIFANEMHFGEEHAQHTHPNSLLSGVFYLHVDSGSSPLVFADPRPFRKFVSLKHNRLTELNQAEYSFDIKSG
jgi:Putative 2OG-Fe(II) oxygenase